MNVFSTLQQQTIIPSATPQNDGQTTAEAARARAEEQRVDFLNLLLTQLANQNPLDPMDTDEFAAQLTRFSILEQGIETNENLTVTNDLLKSNATATSFSYIGKSVEVETNINAIANDKADWSYLIEGDATDVKLTVTDADGNFIDEVNGSISKGVQSYSLDATQYSLNNGQQLYLSINAKDKDGNKLNSQTTATLTVDGVWTNENESFLTSGEISFKTSDVLKIVESGPTT